MTRRQDRQMAIHRAKEAYALWHMYGRKASGFEPCVSIFDRRSDLHRYTWQGWTVWLKPNGALLTTEYHQPTEE